MVDGEFASTPEVSSVSYLVAGHLQVCSTPARLIPSRGTLGLSSVSKLAGGAVDAPTLVMSPHSSCGFPPSKEVVRTWTYWCGILLTGFTNLSVVSKAIKLPEHSLRETSLSRPISTPVCPRTTKPG